MQMVRLYFKNYIKVEKSGLIGQYDKRKTIHEEILMCVRILALKQTNDMGRFLITCFCLVQKTPSSCFFSNITLC